MGELVAILRQEKVAVCLHWCGPCTALQLRDVVVVRAEERVRGEVARAVLSLVPGSGIDVRTLQTYCRERLAVYKVPRIVEFWAEVPKMPNGKIDKGAVLAVTPDPARDERHQADAV